VSAAGKATFTDCGSQSRHGPCLCRHTEGRLLTDPRFVAAFRRLPEPPLPAQAAAQPSPSFGVVFACWQARDGLLMGIIRRPEGYPRLWRCRSRAARIAALLPETRAGFSRPRHCQRPAVPCQRSRPWPGASSPPRTVALCFFGIYEARLNLDCRAARLNVGPPITDCAYNNPVQKDI